MAWEWRAGKEQRANCLLLQSHYSWPMRRFVRHAEKSSVVIGVVAAAATLFGLEILSRYHPVAAYALGGLAALALVIILVVPKR